MNLSRQTILEVQNLSVRFGGFRAVSDLSFRVIQGEILGLVGPNGAGKTTTFNVISGFIRPSGGRVLFKGRDITGLPTPSLARIGIVRTFQQTRVFGHLTVEENVAIGCHLHEPGGLRRTLLGRGMDAHAAVGPRVEEVLAFTGLRDQRTRRGEELPYGDQRVLGIAIALAAAPELLMLDEPFSGMNPAEADSTMALIHRIRGRGVTVLLIDHHMNTLMRHCDRMVVMHHGEKLAEGPPATVRADPAVIATYLGGDGIL
ncbi:MAG: ABC transporter ATP-binding protein [Armatimonadota bacterium]|nr:ABC transporter ATP-binding protein [Armatimonadota bacterium]MDR7475745.1 ABC transporter ATP-binding protein [Armatimonadota bacterium]MDR7538267.1 ABC transporter ATP-binding protein [Armatimonadota bacterium]